MQNDWYLKWNVLNYQDKILVYIWMYDKSCLHVRNLLFFSFTTLDDNFINPLTTKLFSPLKKIIFLDDLILFCIKMSKIWLEQFSF